MKKNLTLVILSSLVFLSNIPVIKSQTVLWANKGVSQGFENGNAICSDEFGNVYVAGQIEYTSNFGSVSVSSYGSHDIFVAKYNSLGALLWIKTAGGTKGDVGYGIGVDAQQNVYITGEIESTARFSSTISLTSSGSNDVFIAKYDANGNVKWARRFGRSNNEKGRALAVSPSGNCYITGKFSSTISLGSSSISTKGSDDVFIVKYDTNGDVVWAKSAGGSKSDQGYGIALDASENVFVTGSFSSSAKFSSTTISSSGSKGSFLAKYNSSGSLQWVKGSSNCCGETISNAVTVDENGNAYITGTFSSSTKFSSTTLTASGSTDVFTVKYNSSGSMQWAKRFGSSDEDASHGVAFDPVLQHVYVTGFVVKSGSVSGIPYSFSGYKDVILAAYDSDGHAKWVTSYGGSRRDIGLAIATNGQGFIYVTGLFNGNASFGSIPLTGHGSEHWADFFVLKILPPSSSALVSGNGGDPSYLIENSGILISGESIPSLDLIRIYPNPSSNRFTFFTEDAVSFRVLNMQGSIVREENQRAGEINFGDELPMGVYYVDVFNGFERRTIPIIKAE